MLGEGLPVNISVYQKCEKLIELEDQKGELSCPGTKAELNGKRFFFFPGKD